MNVVRTVKLDKNKNDYFLVIPESIVNLYSFKKGQIFHLEVKESNNTHKLVLLTYATTHD